MSIEHIFLHSRIAPQQSRSTTKRSSGPIEKPDQEAAATAAAAAAASNGNPPTEDWSEMLLLFGGMGTEPLPACREVRRGHATPKSPPSHCRSISPKQADGQTFCADHTEPASSSKPRG